jgi:hypothetical protein
MNHFINHSPIPVKGYSGLYNNIQDMPSAGFIIRERFGTYSSTSVESLLQTNGKR